MLFAAAFSYILIDVCLALVALVVGFGAALFYFRHTSGLLRGSGSDELARSQEAAANDVERASMAVDQVRDLTNAVADDLEQHQEFVTDVSEELDGVDIESQDSGVAVASAIAKMLEANNKLLTRLDDAEQKIKSQAAEIRAQHTEARTDALTGLANRRAFDDAISGCLTRYKADRQPFSLILLDVDKFKNFNDTHGHQAGDEVLRSVGRTLQRVVKKTDSPCRYGGEEFAVVMPNTNASQGRVAAERIRKAIEAQTIEFEDESLSVTASLGVAEVAGGEEVPQLIRRADDAVYAAKKDGRNNGHWHDGVDCIRIDPNNLQVESTPARTAPAKAAVPPVEIPMPDRDGFLGELSRRVAESHRFAMSLSVMHLRVQDYREIANNYGDAASDLIIESVAGFIRATLREMDLLGRLDEGEFGVMLPGSSENEARLVGKRIQTAISNCIIPLGKTKLRLQMELGVATVEPHDDANTLMERAETWIESPGSPSAVDAR